MATRSTLRAARLVARQHGLRSVSTSAPVASSSTASTSASASASSSPSAGAAATTATPSTSSWKPLLAPGVQPAYDEAIAYLSARSPSASTADVTSINAPSVLSTFTQGQYDASLPVHRHLREKVWRQTGILDKVMQRCISMHVLPDVLPSITPTVDVQVSFGEGAGIGDHGGEGGEALAGVFIDPAHTIQSPEVRITAFHEDAKRYAVAIVDLDSPDVEAGLFRSKLHLLKADVAVSAASHGQPLDLDAASPGTLQGWMPPHPQKGSPYHRYVTVVFEQSGDVSLADAVKQLSAEQKEDFDVSAFADQNGLKPAGIHFWRAKWTKDNAQTVSRVYKDILGLAEPKYARPPNMSNIRKQIGVQGSRFYD